jgi:hypothetical protein
VNTVTGLADPRTGVIPEAHQPTLADMIRYTGLSRPTVFRAIKEIENGWFVRDVAVGRAMRITAVTVPNQSHGETGCPPESAPDPSHGETGLSPTRLTVRLHPSHHETGTGSDTVLPGTTGQVPDHTNTGALFEVDPGPRPPGPAGNPAPPKTDHPQFVAFWDAYPRKIGKGHARKAWTKAIDNGADATTIIAAAEAYAGQCTRNRTEPRFIPHPTTWLNGERWADQPETTAPTNGANTRGLVEYQGHQLKPETVAAMQRREHFAAMDAARQQAAIEGAG